MIKVFVFIPQSLSVSGESLENAWRSLSPPSWRGLRKLVRCSPIRQSGERTEDSALWAFGSAFRYAEVIELSFDSLADFAVIEAEVQAFFDDRLGPSVGGFRSEIIKTEERVIVSGSDCDHSVKALFFPVRKAGLTVEQFQDYWGTRHAAIVPNTPHLARYVQAHVLLESYRSAHPPVFDGVAELWWDNLDDLQEALASSAFQREQPQDAENFVDTALLTGFVAKERRIV